MLEKLARLAGFGAFGASAGLLAAFVGLVYFTWPTTSGGIDMTNSVVTWISLSGLVAALVIVHVAIGRQLLRLGQGADVKHPL